MRVRGILTSLALLAAMSTLSPAALAAKPRPTAVPNTGVTLKSHQACTKKPVDGTKLCIKVQKRESTKKTTYIAALAAETNPVKTLAIFVVGKTSDGKSVTAFGCKRGIGGCASLLLQADKFTTVTAQLRNDKGKVVVETPAIHLPLR